jgi:hypothetical protein
LLAHIPILQTQAESTNLYIKPLLPTTDEGKYPKLKNPKNALKLFNSILDQLRQLFGRFGNIEDCKVMVDRNTGKSRQIGFVRFEQLEGAKRALETMNGYKIIESAPPLTGTLYALLKITFLSIVKYADTQEQKEARKALRMHQQAMSAAQSYGWPTL